MLATEQKSTVSVETVTCLICGSGEHHSALRIPNRFDLGTGDNFQVVCCAQCGFTFLNPRPSSDAVARFYQSDEYQPFLSAQQDRGLLDRLYAACRRYMVGVKRRKIQRLKSGGYLLDVGCGTGEFLHEMQEHGWQVAGIEKDADAARYAIDTYHLQVSSDDLTENKYLKKTYDVVTLWHVLEHLYEPLQALQLMREALKQDGLIVVAVPNVASFDAGFYGSNWVALDAPRHLHHFTLGSLRTLAHKAGLRIFRTRQMPLDAAYNCLMSELLLIEKELSKRFLLPFYMIRAALVATTTVAMSTRLRAEASRRGSSMLYFLKRSESAK